MEMIASTQVTKKKKKKKGSRKPDVPAIPTIGDISVDSVAAPAPVTASPTDENGGLICEATAANTPGTADTVKAAAFLVVGCPAGEDIPTDAAMPAAPAAPAGLDLEAMWSGTVASIDPAEVLRRNTALEAEVARLTAALAKIQEPVRAAVPKDNGGGATSFWQGQMKRLGSTINSKIDRISTTRIGSMLGSIVTGGPAAAAAAGPRLSTSTSSPGDPVSPTAFEPGAVATLRYPELTQQYPSTVGMFAAASISQPAEGGPGPAAAAAATPTRTRLASGSETFSSTSSLQSMYRSIAGGSGSPVDDHIAGADAATAEDEAAREDVRAAQTEVLDAIPDMVDSLRDFSENDEAKLATVNALRVIATRGKIGGKDARLLVLEADAVPALVNLLHNPVVSEASSWALQVLAAVNNPTDPCREEIINCSGLVVMMDMVVHRSPPNTHKRHCVCCMHNLALGSDFVKDLFANDRPFVEALLEHLDDPTMRSTSAVLLAQMSVGSDDRKDALGDVGAIEIISDTLVNLPDAELVTKAPLSLCLRALIEDDPERAFKLQQNSLTVSKLSLMVHDSESAGAIVKAKLNRWGFAAVGSTPASSTKSKQERYQAHLRTIVAAVKRVSTTRNEAGKVLEVGQARIQSNRTYNSSPGTSSPASAAAEIHTHSSTVTVDPTAPDGDVGSTLSTAVWSKLGSAAGSIGESAHRKLSKLATAKRTLGFSRPSFLNRGTADPFDGTTTNRAVSPTSTSSKKVRSKRSFSPEPKLNAADPNERLLRRVTEQTLRREFKLAGGKVTPTQIADRFRSQLVDPDYGAENRARFRAVIDRIAEPVMVRIDDALTQYLVLRQENPKPENDDVKPTRVADVSGADAGGAAEPSLDVKAATEVSAAVATVAEPVVVAAVEPPVRDRDAIRKQALTFPSRKADALAGASPLHCSTPLFELEDEGAVSSPVVDSPQSMRQPGFDVVSMVSPASSFTSSGRFSEIPITPGSDGVPSQDSATTAAVDAWQGALKVPMSPLDADDSALGGSILEPGMEPLEGF